MNIKELSRELEVSEQALQPQKVGKIKTQDGLPQQRKARLFLFFLIVIRSLFSAQRYLEQRPQEQTGSYS